MPFVYPTSIELRSLQQDWISRTTQGRVGLQIMPIRSVNAAKVRWSQKDNFSGLQNLRGMDGAPTRVNRPGYKVYEYEPGVFGEYVDITETELTNRAASMDVMSIPIDVSDLTAEADQYLIVRQYDRIESSIWTLITTGVLQIIMDGPNGQTLGVNDAYSPLTFSASPTWATLATATPIKDFQAIQQLGFAAGRSVDFGAGSVAYMNQKTANLILNNQNANDYGGRRTMNGSTLNSLVATATYWQGQNLPNIVIYDQGYWTKRPADGGVFQKFIPDNKVVVVGQRPGNEDVGNYIMTRNASNGYKPGTYRYVIDRSMGINGEKRTPANIEVHRGHNGGPTLYYPSAVIIMSV